MQKSQSRLSLNKHFAALGAAAAAVTGVGVVQQAEAAIVYSGVQNVAVPANIDGIYMNVVTGATATAGFAGYDINPYLGPSFFTSTTASVAGTRGYVTGFAGGTSTAGALNLQASEVVGPTGTYNEGVTSGTTYAAGTQPGIVGFRFFNEGAAQTQYGWAHIRLPSTGNPGVIVDWAYDNTGAAIVSGSTGQGGTVPEPASLGLLALGAVGLLRRRSA